MVNFCLGQQYCYDLTQTRYICHNRDTLIDKSTSVKYILNRQERCITAVDKNETKLWEINPWEKSPFKKSEDERRILLRIYNKSNYITGFNLWANNLSGNKEVIWLNFHNGEAGFVDKLSGLFYFVGND